MQSVRLMYKIERALNSMTTIQSMATKSLYEQDFYEWLQTNINLLKEGNFADIDLENILEELESMGRSEKNALKSNLRILLMHLLKYKYQPQKRTRRIDLKIMISRRTLL